MDRFRQLGGLRRGFARLPRGQNDLAVSGNGGEVSWAFKVGDLVELGCRIAGRALGSGEWAQSLPGRPHRPRFLSQ